MNLLKEDLHWCLRRLPKDVVKLLKQKKNQLFMAGGFIRACISNEKPSDIDLFSPNKDVAELCARTLMGQDFKIIETENAFTVFGRGRLSVQFIHKWNFEKPEDVLPSFDFTIAKAVIWSDGKNWQSLCDERFYQDLASKRLMYCSPKRIEEVGGSMLRILKFYQRGYRIPLDSLGAVIARIMTGVDFAKARNEKDWAHILSGLLREVDPDVDPSHISHLPDTGGLTKGEKHETIK